MFTDVLFKTPSVVVLHAAILSTPVPPPRLLKIPQTTRCTASGQRTAGYLGRDLPRGFRRGWNGAQLECIANFCLQKQQKHYRGEERGDVQHAASVGDRDADGTDSNKGEDGAESNRDGPNGLTEQNSGSVVPEGSVEAPDGASVQQANGDYSVPFPEVLPQEVLAELVLGTPAGGDVDPTVTGIFKVCRVSFSTHLLGLVSRIYYHLVMLQ